MSVRPWLITLEARTNGGTIWYPVVESSYKKELLQLKRQYLLKHPDVYRNISEVLHEDNVTDEVVLFRKARSEAN